MHGGKLWLERSEPGGRRFDRWGWRSDAGRDWRQNEISHLLDLPASPGM
jgi:hypothetical protein